MSLAGEATASYVDGDAWVCVFCTARNDLALGHCSSCGLSFRGGRTRDADAARPGLRELVSRTLHPGVEAALGVGLFLLWRLADVWAGAHSAGAVGRGRSLAQFEHSLGLPSEASLQQHFLTHGGVVRALNLFYVVGHVPALIVFALWLFRCHRGDFGRWRTRFVIATAVAFAMELVTVAPPRLVPGLGVVDTARRYGESVYAAGGGGFADQYATFPSVHVLWAVLVAAAIVSLGRSRWRWLAVVHPLLTAVTVVATGNHFWVDGVVAAVLAVATHPIGSKAESDESNLRKLLKHSGS